MGPGDAPPSDSMASFTSLIHSEIRERSSENELENDWSEQKQREKMKRDTTEIRKDEK